MEEQIHDSNNSLKFTSWVTIMKQREREREEGREKEWQKLFEISIPASSEMVTHLFQQGDTPNLSQTVLQTGVGGKYSNTWS